MKVVFAFYMLLVSAIGFAVPDEGKIVLLVTFNPAGSFFAESSEPKGNVVKSGNSFSARRISVVINTFRTGNSLRDQHFKKYLNIDKHERAELTEIKAHAGKGTGFLTVNGIKKEITFSYHEKNKKVFANFKVKASDFGLAPVEYLNIKVFNDVKVEAILPYNTI